MELNHFSHDHPLMLVNQVQTEEGENDIVCYGCQKPISSSAYSCKDCNYSLHQKCAELPKEITHQKHLKHPLTLLSYPPYRSSSCICNVCGIWNWKWFTYHCSKCEFDVHIQCVLEDRVVEHESHPHPLTVVHKKALFTCDACFTEDNDLSYFCNTCEFWIHRSCALSPSTIQHNSHDHPLVLNYSLPHIHRSFTFDCDICKEEVRPNFWVYNCDPCRYFVHVKCATSKKMIRGATSETTAEDDELELSAIKFPVVDESVNLLDELLMEFNLGDTNRAAMLTHFSHDHLLILFDNEDETKNDEIIICKGCLLPIISTPFYGCDQCSFFLHGSCAKVPRFLRPPCHQEDHQFNLKMSFTSHDKFLCYSCDRFHNGFRYKCDSCDFNLCVVCALLPVKIRHKAHDHPLRIQRVEKVTVCNGCRFHIRGGLIFRCHTCDYNVDIRCLKYPQKVKHAWDRHLLTLSYPPYSDHPDEFYCELCEEGIHPKFWLYHCHHCDQPFHTKCLFPNFEYRTYGVNAGDTIEVGIHAHKLLPVFRSCDNFEAFGRSQIKMAWNHFSHDHPLTLVNQVRKEEGEEDVVCYGCQKPISRSAYSCNECRYFLHKKCAELPKEITHQKHLEHPLTLLSYPPYRSSSCFCNVCGIWNWKWFTYHCSKCEFDVHIHCVLEDRVVEHESHPHPLTVVHKKALFTCDACFTEDNDLSYFCNTCEFWIHKSCALSPSTIQHNGHDHPLVLHYSLPYIHRIFPSYCDICQEKVHPNLWVYSCDRCRYVVHVKCGTSKTMISDNFEAFGRPQIMKALNHFSHNHPLMLVDHVWKEEGEDVVCYGCQKLISSLAYSCNDCNYFLHKTCAELRKEITHHKHLEHPLTLLSHSPYGSFSCLCDVCNIRDWKWFTYHCSKCEFDVHIQCVLEDRVVEHKSHPHPLTLVHKKTLFKCDACFTEDKDLCYFCNTCEFWIHHSCALSPSTIQHNSHYHPLVLNYSLPYIHRRLKFDCAICKEKVDPNYWVYGCDQCRYFVHVKCATSKTMIRGATTETTAEDDELEPSVIKFPIDDESVNLLDELLKEAKLGDTNRAKMLTHFSHDHQLILFDNEDEMKNDEIIICKGCLLPIISTPFYGCDQCSFFLHGSCAEVPRELRHPCHQDDHQFNLKMSFKSHDKFPCYSCHRFHNGFRYKCDSCDFTLCVVCALLPVKIRHGAHDHPLRIQRVEKVTFCDGCKLQRAGLIYRCHTCDYYVDILCLKLPRKVKHARDQHLLTLRYPPYSDHPDEFYCIICKEEMQPKYWLYHCRHCDQSFHIECLFPILESIVMDVHAGDTIEVGIHPDKLSPIFCWPVKGPYFKCKKCDRILRNVEMFLRCAPCRWQLCLDCAWSNS